MIPSTHFMVWNTAAFRIMRKIAGQARNVVYRWQGHYFWSNWVYLSTLSTCSASFPVCSMTWSGSLLNCSRLRWAIWMQNWCHLFCGKLKSWGRHVFAGNMWWTKWYTPDNKERHHCTQTRSSLSQWLELSVTQQLDSPFVHMHFQQK